MMRFSILFLLLCLSLSCLSCSKHCETYNVVGPDDFVFDSGLIRQGKIGIQELEGKAIEALPVDALDCHDDAIAEDDILNIVVYHPARFDLMTSIQFVNDKLGGFQVVEGSVCLPDMPPIEVIGLTLAQARQRIKYELSQQLQGIDVFLCYRERRSHKVDIAGFAAAASIPVDGKIRLFEVLALARLPPDANLFTSYIVRNGSKLNVDFYKLLKEGDMDQNIVVKGGDKIFIGYPTDSVALVLGEVIEPRPIPMPNGHLSLREALALAHGIPYTGNTNCIQVIRGGIECPKIYVISWNFMLHEQNENLLLMPGDIVYVSRKPIAEWNLVLLQLEPTIQAFFTAQTLYLLTK